MKLLVLLGWLGIKRAPPPNLRFEISLSRGIINMSSCLLLENVTTGIIPVGSMIVLDTGKARVYDSLTDDLEDVLGVAYANANTSGRAFNVSDGPLHYTPHNDTFLYNEDLTFQLDENNLPITDPDFIGFGPASQPETYTYVVYKGFVPIVKPYTALPPRWVLLQANTDCDWILIR